MKEKRNNKKKSKNEEKNSCGKILQRKIGTRAVAVCLTGCMILGLAGCGSGEIGASSGKPGNSVELTAAAEGVPGLEAESQAYCFVGEEDCLTDLRWNCFSGFAAARKTHWFRLFRW